MKHPLDTVPSGGCFHWLGPINPKRERGNLVAAPRSRFGLVCGKQFHPLCHFAANPGTLTLVGRGGRTSWLRIIAGPTKYV